MGKKITDNYWTDTAHLYRGKPHRETVMELAGMDERQVASIIYTIGKQNPDLNLDLLVQDVEKERQRQQQIEEKIAIPRRRRAIFTRLAFWRRR